MSYFIFALIPFIALINSVASQSACSRSNPCSNGACCSKWGNCGYGPDFCGTGCQANCDAKPECGMYADAANKLCPLNVCCSKWGFCGTTPEFCGTGCQSGCAKVSVPKGANVKITRLIGYYALWAVTRPCHRFAPSSIDPNRYTHIIAAFATVTASNTIIPSGSDMTLYQSLIELKQRNHALKIMIAVGGWAFNDPPTHKIFTNMASTESSRTKFANSVLAFLKEYGFDGIDIDWEYPGADDRGGRPQDKANYVLLLKKLRETLGSKYLLTIAAPLSYWYLRHFQLDKIVQYVNWINVMSYDIHGVWDKDIPSLGPYVWAHTNITEIEDGIKLYIRAGVKMNQISLGTGFYARTYTLADSKCTKAGCKFSGPGNKGPCTNEAGILADFEIADILTKRNIKPITDNKAGVQILTWDNQWISYDDTKTLAMKQSFATGAGINGLMIWSIDQDFNDGMTNTFKGVQFNIPSLSQTDNGFTIIEGNFRCPKCHWGKLSSARCSSEKCGWGYMQARLWDAIDWERDCADTPLKLDGVTYYTTRCIKSTFLGFGLEMYGEFHVPDKNCGEWGSFKKDKCSKPGHRQYSSVLWNIDTRVWSWEKCCADMLGSPLPDITPMYPTRCKNEVLNEWGEFDVPDDSCSPADVCGWKKISARRRRWVPYAAGINSEPAVEEHSHHLVRRQPGSGKPNGNPIYQFAADLICIAASIAVNVLNNNNDPVVEYRQGYNNRIEYLYAVVRPHHLNTGTTPNQAMRTFAQTMGRSTDDAGHIVANQLGGTGRARYNIFPQTPNINRGMWARTEATAYNFLARNANGFVEMFFSFEYDSATATRPTGFHYRFAFSDGSEQTGYFINN